MILGEYALPILFFSDMKRYQFGGIQGDNFREFLNICFSHSNYFTLSKDVPNGYDLVPNSAEVALSPYLIKTVSTESWYGFEQISTNMVQNIYYSQKEPMQILFDNYDDIFLQSKRKLKKIFVDTVGRKPKLVSTFENLCFFSKRAMLLGTVSHEYFCSTNEIDEKFANELLHVGAWEKTNVLELDVEKISLMPFL